MPDLGHDDIPTGAQHEHIRRVDRNVHHMLGPKSKEVRDCGHIFVLAHLSCILCPPWLEERPIPRIAEGIDECLDLELRPREDACEKADLVVSK